MPPDRDSAFPNNCVISLQALHCSRSVVKVLLILIRCFAVTGITTYVVLALYYWKPLRATVAPLEDVDPKTLLVDRCGRIALPCSNHEDRRRSSISPKSHAQGNQRDASSDGSVVQGVVAWQRKPL